jgi:hypothetical protein
MKNLAIMAVLATAALAASAASATEVTVSGSRDVTQDNVTGYSVSVAQPVTTSLTINAGFENTVGKSGTNTDTATVGAAYDVATVGPVTLSGLGTVGYADVQAGAMKGSFVKFGAQAFMPIAPNLSATMSVVRQLGNSAVNALDHTEGTVGVRYVVTKDIAVSGSATYYNNIPGQKMALGVSYLF